MIRPVVMVLIYWNMLEVRYLLCLRRNGSFRKYGNTVLQFHLIEQMDFCPCVVPSMSRKVGEITALPERRHIVS